MNAPIRTTDKKNHHVGSFAAGMVVTVMLGVFSSEPANGHGTIGRVVEETAVCVLFTYDDGLPMEYSKVNIKAKGNTFPYQTGGTDKKGRFCFVPDHEGDWTIVANDGMGHRQELSVQVKAGSSAADMKLSGDNKTGRNSRMLNGLCGLSIIFGVSGILAWYRSRNRISREKKNS